MAAKNIDEKNVELEMDDEVMTLEEMTGSANEEEIIEKQYDLMEGLLKAADFKDDDDLKKTIDIIRTITTEDGKKVRAKLFSFTIHPLSETDILNARKNATKKVKNPAGKNLPKIEEVDYVALKSWKIYLATVPEDREKVWDNNAVKSKYGKKLGYELVDVLLTGGEKSSVHDLVDNISGYDDEVTLTDYAKN